MVCSLVEVSDMHNDHHYNWKVLERTEWIEEGHSAQSLTHECLRLREDREVSASHRLSVGVKFGA